MIWFDILVVVELGYIQESSDRKRPWKMPSSLDWGEWLPEKGALKSGRFSTPLLVRFLVSSDIPYPTGISCPVLFNMSFNVIVVHVIGYHKLAGTF